MSPTLSIAEQRKMIVQDLGKFSKNPLRAVRYGFPWGTGELEASGGPFEWQRETLNLIGEHLQNKETEFTPLQIAVASGHGIGKSALIGQIIWWSLSTFPDTKVIVTANTGKQLSTKTVPEVTKWFNMSINSFMWNVLAESISSIQPKKEKSWRADFLTWSLQNAQAFSGLHNAGKRIIVVFDEASEISDKIWEVVQGALSDKDTQIIWLAFGNPTLNTGRFAECFGKFKHRWITKQIDSRTVESTNKDTIQKDVDDWGEDSDFVRVRWRGEFPRVGFSQFISSEDIAKCRKIKAAGYESLPLIFGVDVARFGDDLSVIFGRQGRRSWVINKYRGISTAQLGEHVIEYMDELSPDGVVIDADGLGAGTVDHMAARGYTRNIFEFHGGAAANDSNKYFNRRAEVWGELREALKAGMEIPDLPEIETDLAGPKYGFSSKSQIQLERKEDMKGRGLSSPDFGDALAMTFAVRLNIKKVEDKRKVNNEVNYTTQSQLDDGWMG